MSGPFMSRYGAWCQARDYRIAYNKRRKDWARRLLKYRDLTEPGQETRGMFEGVEYKIWIGPRGGIRITLVYTPENKLRHQISVEPILYNPHHKALHKQIKSITTPTK